MDDMITITQMYWLTRCDSIRTMCMALDHMLTLYSVLACAAGAVFYAFGTFTGNKSYEVFSHLSNDNLAKMHLRLRRMAKWAVAAGVAMNLLAGGFAVARAAVPSTKEMAAILVIPRIANSQTVKELGEGVVGLAQAWLAELRPPEPERKKPKESDGHR